MPKLLISFLLLIGNTAFGQDTITFDLIDSLIKRQDLDASIRSYSMEKTDTIKQGSKILSITVKEAIREEATDKWLHLNIQQFDDDVSFIIRYFFLNNEVSKVYVCKSKGKKIQWDRYIYFQDGAYIGQRGSEYHKSQEIYLQLVESYKNEFKDPIGISIRR